LELTFFSKAVVEPIFCVTWLSWRERSDSKYDSLKFGFGQLKRGFRQFELRVRLLHCVLPLAEII
jgi:hypothetical protein